MRPTDVAAIRRFLEAERGSLEGFDLVVGGSSPRNQAEARRQVRDFAEAGATWWIEFALPGPGQAAEALQRIQAGPPV